MLRRNEEEKAITAESNGKLIDAVEQLEVSLQSPIVPGEMVAWAETLRRSLNALRSPLKEQINQVHQQTIKQIAIEDPELTVRAVNLNSTDEQNLQEFERLLKNVWNLPERVSQAEPDEGSMMTELRELIDDGLKFVLSVRGQETALSTWINESLNRDRGDGDRCSDQNYRTKSRNAASSKVLIGFVKMKSGDDWQPRRRLNSSAD